MRREDLDELHYITPIATVPSICELGILSHRRAESVPHKSVAMIELQEVRAVKVVPGGRPLHEYANLYFTARNAMLRKRQDRHAELCILQVSPDVLDLRGVVVSDRNAACAYPRFSPAPEGLSIVDRALTFAESWLDPNAVEQAKRKAAKCAEVLVPDRVAPKYLIGAYVSCQASLARFSALGVNLPATVNPHLFFL